MCDLSVPLIFWAVYINLHCFSFVVIEQLINLHKDIC